MLTAPFRIRVLLGLFALAVTVFSLTAGPLKAGEAEDRAALDKLFELLRIAPDPMAASAIDQRIWVYWTVPSDPALAGRMREVMELMSAGDVLQTMKLLDKLVVDYPTYAEGWNKRATLYYMIGDFEHSLEDIDKTLQYEPRHFGALSGRVMIYLQQGKRALALKDMATALQIHPFLSVRELFPELEREMTRI
jgi:tetratricopeptide (TPR) repeat protein